MRSQGEKHQICTANCNSRQAILIFDTYPYHHISVYMYILYILICISLSINPNIRLVPIFPFQTFSTMISSSRSHTFQLLGSWIPWVRQRIHNDAVKYVSPQMYQGRRQKECHVYVSNLGLCENGANIAMPINDHPICVRFFQNLGFPIFSQSPKSMTVRGQSNLAFDKRQADEYETLWH